MNNSVIGGMEPPYWLVLLLCTLVGCLVSALLSGCSSTSTVVRFEQRKNIGLSSVQIAEYDIPVLSLSEGPSTTVRQSNDCNSRIFFSGTAVTTNETRALGIYHSQEHKSFSFTGEFCVSPTNGIPSTFCTNVTESTASER